MKRELKREIDGEGEREMARERERENNRNDDNDDDSMIGSSSQLEGGSFLHRLQSAHHSANMLIYLQTLLRRPAP